MRNYLRKCFHLTLCGIFSVCEFSLVFSQQNKPVSESSSESKIQSKLGCSAPAASKNERMTYLVGAGKLSAEDQKRIEGKYGELTIPKGETELAKSIRKAALKRDAEQISNLQKALKTWLKTHPNATVEQIKETRSGYQDEIDRIQNKTEIKRLASLPEWDWRTSLSVGPVMNQGELCNTCWAFATIDAVAASFLKRAKDEIRYSYFEPLDDGTAMIRTVPARRFREESRPSVQELLNCMPIAAADICQTGWHGRAFDFFVNRKGVPADKLAMRLTNDKNDKQLKIAEPPFYQRGKKFKCSPTTGFKKAYSWDYVNSPPDKVPTVEQLKTALIEHGPIAAGIFYDRCLNNYQSGVFNERNLKDINHVVLLVGWDDKKGEKGAWLIKNSWGEEWGEKGFAWIEYGSNNIGQFAAWVDADSKSAWDLFSN